MAKNNLKHSTKKTLTLVMGIVTLSCGSPKTSKAITEIKKIELGMNKNEVINILGEPSKIIEYKKDGIVYSAMLYDPESRLDSTPPSVVICKESELVVRVTVDDTGKFDKRTKSPNPCFDPLGLNK